MFLFSGDSTMFRILSECSATIRKSLEGLDYYVAEGVRAFQDIQAVLDELKRASLLSADEYKQHVDLLLESKRYLKTDYKVFSSVSNHLHPNMSPAATKLGIISMLLSQYIVYLYIIDSVLQNIPFRGR